MKDHISESQIVDSQIAESIFPISKLPNDEKLLVVKSNLKTQDIILRDISTWYHFLQSDCLAVYGCRRLSFLQSDYT
jgi:hypothetical protein